MFSKKLFIGLVNVEADPKAMVCFQVFFSQNSGQNSKYFHVNHNWRFLKWQNVTRF
jgi:hypothetical protein